MSEADFGAHAAAVASVIGSLAPDPAGYDYDVCHGLAAGLGQSLANLAAAAPAAPGSSRPASPASIVDEVRRLAVMLDPEAAQAITLAVSAAIDGFITVHADPAAHASARALTEAAALWPAVFGDHPNPFAGVAGLVSRGAFPACEDGGIAVYHHQLVQTFAWPEAAAPKPVVVIARNLDF